MFTFINMVKRNKQSIANKIIKMIIRYGDSEDNFYEEWKEKNSLNDNV